ncbi:MAG TPA: ice-binding family protein [Candidatus Dormibacteraeota bacterium]|nr:ice-binding family protein [Candidatus Dormibacteraeota bacterium]
MALSATAPDLATAKPFAILAYSTITNSGPSVITGNIGVSPGPGAGPPVTGFGGAGNGTLNGTQYNPGDPVAIKAKVDLSNAFDFAALAPCDFDLSNQNLGGKTLVPGVYCQTTAPTITGTVTLSGNGIFIFQIGSTLVTAPNATIFLTNGAQDCNVFWEVRSSATLDTATTFVGTIMALAKIELHDTAKISGRALAENAEVTLINNRITVPTTCTAATVGGPSPTPTPSPVPKVPNTGGGPEQGGSAPWVLALVTAVLGGVGVVGLGLRYRGHRRSE